MTEGRPCCAPARGGGGRSGGRVGASAGEGTHRIEQVHVPSGTFVMGDDRGDGHPADGESPARVVATAAYDIDAVAVSNDDFAAFVDATGHVTTAEEWGWSAVVRLFLQGPDAEVVGVPEATPWWVGVRGADWRRPEGPRSDLDGRGDHPVVHVSWDDAVAYCAWAGRRLPSEAEWERASRAGREGLRYPWGDTLRAPDGGWRCNIWQGDFPRTNTAEDGWVTTAPVRSYAPNAWGLWQTIGNVWEWCDDWFDARRTTRVMRGGSFLCHDSWCNRYRNAARSSNTPDSSTANTGFRTVGA